MHTEEKIEYDWTRGYLPGWAKMLICVLGVLLILLIVFRVKNFEVSGNVRYTAEEIADASGISDGDMLLGVNKIRAAGRILTNLPYIERLEIHRYLPGTVSFEVEECSAAGVLVSEFSALWLVNSEGKLLERVDATDAVSYTQVTGVSLVLPSGGDQATFDDEEKGKLAMELLNLVVDSGLSGQISTISMEDANNIVMVYNNALELQLGTAENAAYQLAYFQAVKSKLSSDAAGTLDLTFTERDAAIYHPVSS